MSAPETPVPATAPRIDRLKEPTKWLIVAGIITAALTIGSIFLPWVTFDNTASGTCNFQAGRGEVITAACDTKTFDGREFAEIAGPSNAREGKLVPGVTHINRASMPVSLGVPKVAVLTTVALAFALCGLITEKRLLALPAIYPMFASAPGARTVTEWFITDPANGGQFNTTHLGYRLATGELFRLSQLIVVASVAVCIVGWRWAKKDNADAGITTPSVAAKLLGVVAAGSAAALASVADKHPEAKD